VWKKPLFSIPKGFDVEVKLILFILSYELRRLSKRLGVSAAVTP
jgi:hypothetical protein